jgi:hypothetical protein
MRWMASSVCFTVTCMFWITVLICWLNCAGAAGKVAHFVGHHGKAAPGLAGPRRLDGGIQRQQVGLLGNGADLGKDGLHVAGAGDDVVGQFDQFDAELAVVDDAVDHALHDGRCP